MNWPGSSICLVTWRRINSFENRICVLDTHHRRKQPSTRASSFFSITMPSAASTNQPTVDAEAGLVNSAVSTDRLLASPHFTISGVSTLGTATHT